MNGKKYLLTALIAVAIGVVAFAVRNRGFDGELGLCGDFCKRLGCNHSNQGPESLTDQERPSSPEGSARSAPACQLSQFEYADRMSIVRELYQAVVSTRELADGYEMTFPGDATWGRKLFDFVNAERQCCPFFLFELKFEPDQGPIRLSMRGGPEVKEFLQNFQLPEGN